MARRKDLLAEDGLQAIEDHRRQAAPSLQCVLEQDRLGRRSKRGAPWTGGYVRPDGGLGKMLGVRRYAVVVDMLRYGVSERIGRVLKTAGVCTIACL